MTDSTARHALPLIAAGQADKELFHNEALALLDLLSHPFAEAVGIDTPPSSPGEGQCWIVGASPTGAWSGHAQALAGWTAGGWRFASPRPGMIVRLGTAAGFTRYADGAWNAGEVKGATLRLAGDQVVGPRAAAIADAAGGTVIDIETRAAVNAILVAMRGHGLIAE